MPTILMGLRRLSGRCDDNLHGYKSVYISMGHSDAGWLFFINPAFFPWNFRICSPVMWTCPKCKQKFYNRNQSHSCGNFSVREFLSGKSEKAIVLFNAFLEAYQKIGNYELHPVKTRVALLTQMRFASINRLAKEYLNGHLVLTTFHEEPDLFFKVDNLNNRFYVHHFRLHDVGDVNRKLQRYMKMAYRVGQRKHVKKRSS